jgi:hypothetical protein
MARKADHELGIGRAPFESHEQTRRFFAEWVAVSPPWERRTSRASRDGPAMRAINSLDSFESTGGVIIRDLLDKLNLLDQEIMKTIPIAKAVEDGSLKVRAHYTLDHIWRVGRSYVNRLARYTKIAISGDVFSTSSNSRDSEAFFSGDPSERRGTSSIL